MKSLLAFLIALVIGMWSGATGAAKQLDSLVGDDITVAPIEQVANELPEVNHELSDALDAVYPTWKEDQRFVDQIRGITVSSDTARPPEYAKRSRSVLKIHSRDGAGEQLSIRILRRARGACSGGRCG